MEIAFEDLHRHRGLLLTDAWELVESASQVSGRRGVVPDAAGVATVLPRDDTPGLGDPTRYVVHEPVQLRRLLECLVHRQIA
jgi:hypothetical protein